MPDTTDVKERAKKIREVASQLREMEHYSKTNMEKLSAFWLLFEEEVKNEEFSEKVSTLMNSQAKFEEDVLVMIKDLEIRANRLEQDA